MDKIEKLRKKYMENPPETYTKEDISNLSDDELLKLDEIINKDIGDIPYHSSLSLSGLLNSTQFKCENCGHIEYIRPEIVKFKSEILSNSNVPITFKCRKCNSGIMYPVINNPLKF